jgi:hypothetical protein
MTQMPVSAYRQDELESPWCRPAEQLQRLRTTVNNSDCSSTHDGEEGGGLKYSQL